MMIIKKLSVVAGLLATSWLTSGHANAADEIYGAAAESGSNPFYLELRVGGPIPRKYDFSGAFTGQYDPDPGFFIAGAVGKYFSPNFRGDITLSYGRGEDGVAYAPGPVPHTGSVSATSILANGYYMFNDVVPMEGVTPYVGAGAGVTIFNYDNLGGGIFFNDSASAATVAAHVGIDYALTDMIDLTGRYSLTWTDDHSISNPVVLNSASHTNNIFTIGLRFKLNR